MFEKLEKIKDSHKLVLLEGTPSNKGIVNNEVRGVYSSYQALREGVYSLLLKEKNIKVLHYRLVIQDHCPTSSINEWDWAYIPIGTNQSHLAVGGGTVPLEKFWGQNLIGFDWSGRKVKQ